MIRYRLDDLGWYQFEWLVQTVLKERLGIGVESWGGRGDHGRDAWCTGRLRFPANDLEEGPFLFQVKFIENANATGARPNPRLLAAVAAEMKRQPSHNRKPTTRAANCKHYVLLTNSPTSPEVRLSIAEAVKRALPKATPHVMGGGDICDWLDASPAVRRSFPQLLSLRDLDVLLESVVNRDILQRSSAAISHAKEVVPVFVPTGAYARAWDVLRKHHFVVLDGPPEMGKSAIAWMIALSQIANGWEAYVCDTPGDFFKVLRADASQIFIADDAFGRTEYDPTRGHKWEAELHRVFHRLNKTQWLIWTSRKHILERFRAHTDLQGPASTFPQPGEVLVDAGSLSIQEKALILYRHAKHSITESSGKSIIHRHAEQIVYDEAFTPERIRRLVIDIIPTLATESGASLTSDVITSKIRAEIQNPTDRMRKSYQALQLHYKRMLLGLLELEDNCTVDELARHYQNQYPNDANNPRLIVDGLTEAFIRTREATVFVKPRKARGMRSSSVYVDWIHPSYRDLVIEQLRSEGGARTDFLSRTNVAGIKLSLSEAGGVEGKLKFPLLTSSADWDILQERCHSLAQESTIAGAAALLRILAAPLDSCSISEEKERLRQIVALSCRVIRERWNKERVALPHSVIEAYSAASEQTLPMEPMPMLEASWKAAVHRFQTGLGKLHLTSPFNSDFLDEFLGAVKAIQDCEPRLLRRVGFPNMLNEDIDRLLAWVDRELKEDRDHAESDAYEAESEAAFSLLDSLRRLKIAIGELDKPIKETISRLQKHANWCSQRCDELREEEPQDEDDAGNDEDYREFQEGRFEIEPLFLDL